jgi:hypothetical protein
MKFIEYRVQYSEGEPEIISVRARDINSGFGKALKIAKQPLGSGRVREIARLEFWQIP